MFRLRGCKVIRFAGEHSAETSARDLADAAGLLAQVDGPNLRSAATTVMA
jgi:hypothetical protein